MQKIQKLYRSEYAGESVITQLTLVDGEWHPITEYVPNGVFSTHTSTQAVAIGNGESRANFDLSLITNHSGGLLAENRLQSYGCNALYRDYAPNFLIATGDQVSQEIANSDYTKNNIVYSGAKTVLAYPGQFYLIPQNLDCDAGAIAAYMACFDGHSKVFLLGYDSYDVESITNNVYKDTTGYPLGNQIHSGEYFARSLCQVVSTYSDVEFIRVMPTSTWSQPAQLMPCPNFRQINYREFVIEADIG